MSWPGVWSPKEHNIFFMILFVEILLSFCFYLHQRNNNYLFEKKKKVFIKRSLHGENSSLSFIEAVHQWL